jgi:hypothetical protein
MDTKYSPEYLIRAYLWAVLKENTTMKESDYNGKVPIIPLSDEREFANSGKPYIIWGYASDPTYTGEHYRQRGTMSFLIYSNKFNELQQIMTILHTTFNREDDAASDINAFTSTIPQFIGIRFGTVSVGFMEGPAPEETEGGRQSALLNIRYEYYVDYSIKKFLPLGASYTKDDGSIDYVKVQDLAEPTDKGIWL